MSFSAPNGPDFVQSYLMGYATLGGALGGVGYAYMGSEGASGYLKHALIGGASGWALRYVNRNVLGTPGQSMGPIPDRYVPMTISGAVAGYAVSWLVGARV